MTLLLPMDDDDGRESSPLGDVDDGGVGRPHHAAGVDAVVGEEVDVDLLGHPAVLGLHHGEVLLGNLDVFLDDVEGFRRLLEVVVPLGLGDVGPDADVLPAVLVEGFQDELLPVRPREFPDVLDGLEQDGTQGFPPRVEDEQVRDRIVTWIRIRLRQAPDQSAKGTVSARLSWLGINAIRVVQAVSVINELLGSGTGEPDQAVTLAHNPVIERSLKLEVEEELNPEDERENWRLWRDYLPI